MEKAFAAWMVAFAEGDSAYHQTDLDCSFAALKVIAGLMVFVDLKTYFDCSTGAMFVALKGIAGSMVFADYWTYSDCSEEEMFVALKVIAGPKVSDD